MLTPYFLNGLSPDYREKQLASFRKLLFSDLVFYTLIGADRLQTSAPPEISDKEGLYRRLAENSGTVLYSSSKTPMFDTFFIVHTEGDAVLFDLFVDGYPTQHPLTMSMLCGTGYLVRARRNRAVRRILLPTGLLQEYRDTRPRPSEFWGLDGIPI